MSDGELSDERRRKAKQVFILTSGCYADPAPFPPQFEVTLFWEEQLAHQVNTLFPKLILSTALGLTGAAFAALNGHGLFVSLFAHLLIGQVTFLFFILRDLLDV